MRTTPGAAEGYSQTNRIIFQVSQQRQEILRYDAPRMTSRYLGCYNVNTICLGTVFYDPNWQRLPTMDSKHARRNWKTLQMDPKVTS